MINKITKTSLFLLPGLELDERELVSIGLLNTFIGDSHDTVSTEEYPIYLLFKIPSDKQTRFEEFALKIEKKIIDEYDTEDRYTVLVLSYPEKWRGEYRHFLNSKYSRFSPEYKKLVKKEVQPLEKFYSRRVTMSSAYAVLNRLTALIKLREEEFGVEFTDDMELAPLIKLEEETICLTNNKICDEGVITGNGGQVRTIYS